VFERRSATSTPQRSSPRTNAFRLPGLINDDFSATKGFKFIESSNLQFRVDIFNLFKHYNPDPNTVVNALTPEPSVPSPAA
jgi:hypothetical protein